MKDALSTKLYYSISEVAQMTSLPSYTLRAWEKEFSCLRPRRVHGKNRAYRRRDVGIILLIKRLLYEERYTVQGVRQKLRSEADLMRVASERALAELLSGDPAAEEQMALPGFVEPARTAAEVAPGPGEGGPIGDEERQAIRQAVECARQELRQLLARMS